MLVKITGTVDSVKQMEKDGRSWTEVFLNQRGEQQKAKVKLYSGAIPKLDETITFEGVVVAGAFNGSPYKFIRVN